MLKPGLKLVIKDEDTKWAIQATLQKTPTQEDDIPNPALKPHGLVDSCSWTWIWDFFKKDNKKVKKNLPVLNNTILVILGKYYTKI